MKKSYLISGCTLLLVWVVFALSAAQGKTFYVDGELPSECAGKYSITKRDCSGSDGAAVTSILQAARTARAGDTVILRGGIYNKSGNQGQYDLLWPEYSGRQDAPITFKAFGKEQVILSMPPENFPDTKSHSRISKWESRIKTIFEGGNFPDNAWQSINKAIVVMKNVNYIVIEGLTFKDVPGWLFARRCDHVTVRNCRFENAYHGAKGTAHFIECNFGRIENCDFKKASFDSLQIEASTRFLIANCRFNYAEHSLLALRGSSFNVIRNCWFVNPFYRDGKSEKLVEVYDIKVDKRSKDNPSYMPEPLYDHTKYNLFEYNYFGYHPFMPNRMAQPSAIQYSGQNGIIRKNLFYNPKTAEKDKDYQGGEAGGAGLTMRWGGSWDGWFEKRGWWVGEGIEAGFVTGNRIYNNTMYGYDNGLIIGPSEDSMRKVLNPPPMHETNPTDQFSKKYAFGDNVFMNNLLLPGIYLGHINWSYMKLLTGKPAAVVLLGQVDGGMKFINNDLYSDNSDELIYYHDGRYGPPKSPAYFNKEYQASFIGNLQKDPMLTNAEKGIMTLKDGSPMIDAGCFLTQTVGGNPGGTEMRVKDAGFFYDGFGIGGEQGDVVQFEGSDAKAHIVAIDYKTNTIRLNKPLTWKDGQGVALAYIGRGPDIGAFEKGMETKSMTRVGEVGD